MCNHSGAETIKSLKHSGQQLFRAAVDILSQLNSLFTCARAAPAAVNRGSATQSLLALFAQARGSKIMVASWQNPNAKDCSISWYVRVIHFWKESAV